MTRKELTEHILEDFYHVVGYPGAGKSTLMRQFKTAHPSLAVRDSDDFGAKRHDQVTRERGKFSPDSDHQLEVDALVAADIEQFAAKYERNKTQHGMVVGLHFARKDKKHPLWRKYQLGTGSLRSTRRMLKRDNERLSLKDRAKAYVSMHKFNRRNLKPAYKHFGYTTISVGKLKKKVAKMYGKQVDSPSSARRSHALRAGVHTGLAVGHGLFAFRNKDETIKALNTTGAGVHGLFAGAHLSRVLQRDPRQSPYVTSKRKGQKGTRINRRKDFKGYLWNRT